MARRTKEDALATREALLDAAVCVFGRRGVARSSLAEIAEQEKEARKLLARQQPGRTRRAAA